MIVSKKSMADEETKKKQIKPKKKDDQPEDESFSHAFDTKSSFDYLKLLPPQNLGEVDQVIKQIQDRLTILNAPTPE